MAETICRYCDRGIGEGRYFCPLCGLIDTSSELYAPCPECGHPDPIAKANGAPAWLRRHGAWYLGPLFVIGLIPALRWVFTLGSIFTALAFGLVFYVLRGVRRQCPECEHRY